MRVLLVSLLAGIGAGLATVAALAVLGLFAFSALTLEWQGVAYFDPRGWYPECRAMAVSAFFIVGVATSISVYTEDQ